ncbi:type VI secretion system protein TssA [Pseudomonas sp. xss_4]|uniref:type VI secretion system protein TssA n=1 Tax=Pseudomonas TaxID=286 RepID=UPI0015F6E935|nr:MULTISPECIES: type VI secretion system protein TssA [Pseudomonas putida group]MBA5708125.1 type VI secretion system protein TssA [Pseudomonas fulva]MBF8726865.1 type VI secretion system protein TssA [Pseudomonas putida]MBF8766499.1 type VI secretion system protein TssA [Pseudomonas putida]
MYASPLLAAVSADFPCGEDLEYDAEFLQLERDAQGRPERVMGDAVQPAEPPQWRDIEQACSRLLQRSKDLRITHFLLQANLALHGLPGLATSLELIRDLLAEYWLYLHPQLDAADDNDPTVRVNALAGLTCDTNIGLLRDAVLVRSRAFGPVTLRAALHAAGVQHFASEQLSAEELAAALRDADEDQVLQCQAALQLAREAVDVIEQRVNDQVGSASGVDLSALRQPLRQVQQVLADYAPAGAGPALAATEAPVTTREQAPPAAASPSARPAARPGEVNSREDVQQSLDRLLQYYARHEPSSPLPVLLHRAKRLVNADFATIVRDLIPDGWSQFENLRGTEDN